MLDNRRLYSAKPIGELLVEHGLVSTEHVIEALEKQRREGGRVVDLLIAFNRFSSDDFLYFLARQLGLPSVDLSCYEIPEEVVRLVSREFVLDNEIIPLDKLGCLITVAMVCPLDSKALERLQNMTGCKANPVLCSSTSLRDAVQRYYPVERKTLSPLS